MSSCDLGPPMYASREPSGESAMRPDQDEPFAIASVESTTNRYRTTGFDEEGRTQPQIAAPDIRIAIGITAYSAILSRRRLFLPSNVLPATGGVTDGLVGASTDSSADRDWSCGAFLTAGDSAVSAIGG